jgi:hypothetical protein
LEEGSSHADYEAQTYLARQSFKRHSCYTEGILRGNHG